MTFDEIEKMFRSHGFTKKLNQLGSYNMTDDYMFVLRIEVNNVFFEYKIPLYEAIHYTPETFQKLNADIWKHARIKIFEIRNKEELT